MRSRNIDDIAPPSYVDDSALETLLDAALREDVGTGDITTESTVRPGAQARAVFVARKAGVLAGAYVAGRVFHRVDPTLEIAWSIADGENLTREHRFGSICGTARSILTGERLALNFLQRMSGIATATRHMVEAVEGTRARILDTRKTAPGLRMLDKWAVLLGGGANHRVGLFDMILIKENHIGAAGSIEAALDAVQGRGLVEIEAETLEDVRAILAHGGADRILLDNMTSTGPEGSTDTSTLEEAIRLIDGRLETEASGNVRLDSVRAIAETGVDFISSGALTHSVRALDVSLLIEID